MTIGDGTERADCWLEVMVIEAPPAGAGVDRLTVTVVDSPSASTSAAACRVRGAQAGQSIGALNDTFPWLAVSVTVPPTAVGKRVTGKKALDAPSGTTTWAAGIARLVSLLVMLSENPPDGAYPLSPTSPPLHGS